MNGFLPNKNPSYPDLSPVKNIGIGTFTITIPKLQEFPVRQGNINNEKVYLALASYHPLANKWVKIMSTQLKVPSIIFDIADIPK